jgi:uridylate kinase
MHDEKKSVLKLGGKVFDANEELKRRKRVVRSLMQQLEQRENIALKKGRREIRSQMAVTA